jgi:glycine betaine/proline transport system permease protein
MAVAPPKQLRVPEVEAPLSRTAVRLERNPWPVRLAWVAGIVAVLVIGVTWLDPGFPDSWVIGVESWFEAIENWIIDNQRTHWLFTSVLGPLSDTVDSSIKGVINALSRMTWFGLVVGAAGLAGIVAGWRMAVLAGLGVLSFGVLGVWEASLQTLALMLVAVLVSLAIGVPLGIWAGRKPRAERFLRSLMDAMQTIPAYSYLLPCVLFLGIGYPPALIATVIFALPPAVRLTALGIRNVPSTALDVSGSFGATSRQTLGKVQIPLAKPSMMLGVNQTIMMALGMVVIAAVVGAPGLGREVLNGLKQLDVGEALNGGIAIVVMAIVLDRVTTAWSQRDQRRSRPVRLVGWTVSRRMLWISLGAVTILAVVIGRELLRQQDFPEALTTSVAAPANAVVEWSRDNLTGVADTITNVLLRYGLDPLRDLLLGVPWWMVAGAVGLIAWRVSGPRLGLGLFACVFAIGLIGTWDLSMETLAVVLVAVLVAITIAIPLGIVAARSDGFDRAIRPLLDAMQTMPAFVYLVPVLLLFAPGRVPAVIASVVYALPVGIRLTSHGIRSVSKEAVEAGNAYGSTAGQLLRKVQLPLARPSILLGVNQTIMMVLSVVIIAGLIGGGGLGFDILVALSQRNIGRGLVGGLSILLLAVVLDRITQAMGAAPKTTRGPVGLMGQGRWTKMRALMVKQNGNGKGEG